MTVEPTGCTRRLTAAPMEIGRPRGPCLAVNGYELEALPAAM
jgi:hypothetical protein